MKDYVFVVKTQPVPGQDAAFNDWYDNRHIADVLAVPGVVAARRFKGESNYLAFYSIRTEDHKTVLNEIGARAGTERMPMSSALDEASIDAQLYEEIGPWIQANGSKSGG